MSQNSRISTSDRSLKQRFGADLAEFLGQKIHEVYPEFHLSSYTKIIHSEVKDSSYTQRVELHSKTLRDLLPRDYLTALEILMDVLGEENPHETGMFKNYYWVMPIAKFVEQYGLESVEYYEASIQAIEQITKRNTGEYAIRPYIRARPDQTMEIMQRWSLSQNFHLRRLSAEGCRPKLPWANKLNIFVQNPEPVFRILRNLMKDEVRFVQKSVANNIADYLKVNPKAAHQFIAKYQSSLNKNTQWILNHAQRNLDKKT